MGAADVSNVLWREREQLELLLFKLEEEQLVLASGRTRWLAHASREVQLVLDQLRQTELLRAVEVDAYAGSLGMGPDPSLKDLALVAGTPWADLLLAHRDALVELTAEVARASAANREAVAAGLRATTETLLSLNGQLETYAPTGTRTSPARSHLVDTAL